MSDRSNQPPVLQLNPADPLVVATRDLGALATNYDRPGGWSEGD